MSKAASFRTSKAFAVASKMPSGLHHSFPDQPFNIEESEVIHWLLSQPDVLNYLFQKVKDSDAIVYDSKSKTWHGKDVQNAS